MKHGARLIVVGPSPEYQLAVPKILGLRELYGLDLGDRALRKDRVRADRQLRQALPMDFEYFSLIQRVCKGERCDIAADGAPIFFDDNHFTEPGAEAALRGLDRCIQSAASCQSGRSVALQ